MIFIYNIIFIIVFGFIVKNKINDKKYKILFLFICFFQMFLIQALRDPSVGTDTLSYVTIYDKYNSSDVYGYLFTHYEFGVRSIIEFFKYLNFGHQALLVFTSFVIILGFAIFIYFNSKNIILSTIIFAAILYPNSFNVARQYMACAIAINAITLLRNKKYISSIIIFIISLLFHKITLLFLFPIIIAYIRDKRIIVLLSLILLVSALIFGEPIMYYFLKMFRGEYYINGDYDANRIFRMTTLLTFIYAFFILYMLQSAPNKYENRLMISFVLINAIFGILYLKNEVFSRVIELFNTYLLVSIPYSIYIRKDKYDILYKISICGVSIFLMCLFVFYSEAGIGVYKMFF